MGEMVKLLFDTLGHLWPLRIVNHWERGLYYVCGCYVGWVGRGCYPVIPWFFDVHTVSMVPDVFLTPLKSVTTRGGVQLTYSCSVTFRVTCPSLAFNELHDYRESIVEITNGVLSDGMRALADTSVTSEELLQPLRASINHTLKQYGVEVVALRLDNFVVGARTLRLLQDLSAKI